MKSSTQDQAEGKFHGVRGKVKEVVGELSDDPDLEAEGAGEKIVSKVQKKIGQVKKVFGKWCERHIHIMHRVSLGTRCFQYLD